ncbi:MAG: HAMP domain-containing histidine kinase [Anaerolineae bacterium]|nr:HAMP domain-containing histidine kinase [Anaerolineae bacterium]
MSEEKDSPIAHHVLSSIAHDLRSPLNAIIGFSRIMIKGLDGPLSDMQLTDLEAIYTNGQMMLEMVNNVIDLGKAEAGSLTPGNAQVYLEPVVEKVISQAASRIPDDMIQIESESSDLLISVQVEETHIQQLLVDLLSVAIHFVQAGRIVLKLESDRSNAILSIVGTATEALSPGVSGVVEAYRSGGQSPEHRIDNESLKLLVSDKRVALYRGSFWIDMPSDNEFVLAFQIPTIRSQT